MYYITDADLIKVYAPDHVNLGLMRRLSPEERDELKKSDPEKYEHHVPTYTARKWHNDPEHLFYDGKSASVYIGDYGY